MCLAPRQRIQAILIFVVIVFGLTVWQAMQLPWLGINFAGTDENGLQVETVAFGPASDVVKPGERIKYLVLDSKRKVLIAPYATLADPDMLPAYRFYNAFLSFHQIAYRQYQTGRLRFELSDGRRIALTPEPGTALTALSINFWWMNILGLCAVLIGSAVWCYQNNQLSARLFFLSGFAFFLNTSSSSIYATRELLIDPELLLILSNINNAGCFLFAYFIVALFWVYPTRLGGLKYLLLGFGFMSALWLNRVFQLFEWPIHTYSLPVLLPLLAGIVLAVLQWRNTCYDPLKRACLKWFILAVQLSLLITVGIWFFPLILQNQAIVSMAFANSIALGVYLGIAFGVSRYKLFNLERWWSASLVWLGGGLFILLVDMALLATVNINKSEALGLAVLISAWFYLPVRQFIWSRLLLNPSRQIEKYYIELVKALVNSGSCSAFTDKWSDILCKVFNPMSSNLEINQLDHVRVINDGLSLAVPGLDGRGMVLLQYADQGSRLFNSYDIELANALFALARQTLSIQAARQQGVQEERKRIMRDLHDDVAPALTTALYKSNGEDQKVLIASAIQTLRGTIYSLKSERGDDVIRLENAVADWRAEIGNQIEAVDKEFDWVQSGKLDNVSLTARQYIDIGRIMREAIANAIRHGSSECIAISVKQQANNLIIALCDRNKNDLIEAWKEGVGTSSMRKRAEEIGAMLQWGKNPEHSCGVCVYLTFPLVPV